MSEDDSNSIHLNDAIAAVKEDQPSGEQIKVIAQRVRSKISDQGNATRDNSGTAPSSTGTTFNSIEHYIAAIPDYLAGRLTGAQKLLFEEEGRHSLPLRRALSVARQQALVERQAQAAPIKQRRYLRWFGSAAAIVVIGFAAILAVNFLPSFDQSRLLQVADINGTLYRVVDGRLEPLQEGAWIDGQQPLRTAHNSTALLRLDDESRIEVNGRSQLSVTRRPSGNLVNVERGQIIVAASPQGSGHLDVATNEFVVSVKGTIFQVGHGTLGSQVAVIEGEVQVHQDSGSTSLTSGEQLVSRDGTAVAALGIEEDIAWSRDADQYLAMLEDVAELQQAVQAALETPPRFSTRLLNLAPENTLVYMAVPNAPGTIADVYQLINERMRQSQNLDENWLSLGNDADRQRLDELMSWLSALSDHLGDETAVALELGSTKTVVAQDRSDGISHEGVLRLDPVILSEVDAAAFRNSFNEQMEKFRAANSAGDGTGSLDVVIVDSPAQAQDNRLNIWLVDDLLVASTNAASLQNMAAVVAAGSSHFVNTEMYALLLDVYRDGAQFLATVDLQKLKNTVMTRLQHVDGVDRQHVDSAMQMSGLDNADFLVVNRRQRYGEVTLTADLLFAGDRAGVMSWLSVPEPMGSLEFFSTDSTIVNAILLKDPAVIFDEVWQAGVDFRNANPDLAGHQLLGSKEFAGEDFAGEVFTKELRNDVLAALGGEIAMGLDGPALPVPALKLVIEVYDELRLQDSIEKAVAEFNRRMSERGGSARFEVVPQDVEPYLGYRINFPAIEMDDVPLPLVSGINYAYVDGYIVITADIALLKRAITQYRSGVSLLMDGEFQSLLPPSGRLDFSAISFNRIRSLLLNLAFNLPNSVPQKRELIRDHYRSAPKATLYTLTGTADSIQIFQNGNTFLSDSISSVVSMYSLFKPGNTSNNVTVPAAAAPAVTDAAIDTVTDAAIDTVTDAATGGVSVGGEGN